MQLRVTEQQAIKSAIDKKVVFIHFFNVDNPWKMTNDVNMIGKRIRQARLAAGVTLEEVANDLSDAGTPITKAGLSKYEKGKSVPNPSFFVALAKRLAVKPSYFVTEPSCNIQWHAFRKQAKLPKKIQEHVKASAERRIESQLWLISVLTPDEQPKFPKPFSVSEISQVEDAASHLRTFWKLRNQTIGCLVELAEAHGVIVVAHSGRERDRQFDGLSGRVNGGFPVAVISTSVPDNRIRYTLAHELGRLAMDCGNAEEREEEEFAHRFASAFIVPQEVMRKELGDKRRSVSLREFAVLKQKHGLSMQSLVRRARDLDIISESHYSSLFRKFSSMGWRKKEPVDYRSDEQPKRLLQMVLRAVSEGIISADRAEEILPGSSKESLKKFKRLSARELRKMPAEERQATLSDAAQKAEQDYLTEAGVMDFEAFGEDDLYDDF